MDDSYRPVFAGRIITVALERVELPDGRRFDLEVVHHPGGAAVVALDREQRVCLLRQYRHVAGGWLWELPAGKRDQGEPPERTARRELAEEAGVSAAEWTPLGPVYSSPGVFDEVVHLYLARDLTPAIRDAQPDEQIEVHWVALDTALQWAVDGVIGDAKSLIGLFRAAARVREGYRGSRDAVP